MTIAEVNALPRAGFVAEFGWIFEDSPWVAEKAWDARPFVDLAALRAAMVYVVETASRASQLGLLRAHPDLGARARMSDASTGEQAGVGLDRMSPGEFERLQSMNTCYRDRFGFPFLYAVKGSTVPDILTALARRVEAPPEVEFQEALAQVFRIASFRLRDVVTGE